MEYLPSIPDSVKEQITDSMNESKHAQCFKICSDLFIKSTKRNMNDYEQKKMNDAITGMGTSDTFIFHTLQSLINLSSS